MPVQKTSRKRPEPKREREMRQENRGELADALEPVAEESDDADESVDDHDEVRQLSAPSGAEARPDPLRAGHHLGAAQPCGKVNHEEDLIEGGPEPGNPHAFQAVDEHPGDQQHGAADVEHARCVGDAQHIPGHLVAAQKIGLHVLRGAVRNPVADEHRAQQIDHNNDNIQNVQMHLESLDFLDRNRFSAIREKLQCRFLADHGRLYHRVAKLKCNDSQTELRPRTFRLIRLKTSYCNSPANKNTSDACQLMQISLLAYEAN